MKFVFLLLSILGFCLLSSCSEESAPLNPALANDTIEGKVEAILAEQLGKTAGSFSLDDLLVDDLGADDLDIVEFVIAIEVEFAVKIPDEELFEPTTSKEELGAPRKLTGNDFVRIVKELGPSE